MHENNVALLCDEAGRLLQLNIELLHKMINEPKVLANDQGQLFARHKAEKRVEELEGERLKIARKEIVLAVVGTMKAGKSTTINAIVGKEILPNRNRPMTSIPTLIRHVPGKLIPDLQLNNTDALHNLLIDLNRKISTPEGKHLVRQLEKDSEKKKLLAITRNVEWLKDTYLDEEEIFSCLTHLNDLVRLASELEVEFPFDAYDEFHELPVIEVEFSHLTSMDDSQGTLTLLDTPGPNEAGQPHLQAMMRDQLQKASAVLAVLDYTQLNSLADQNVRKELNAIAEVAAGRLFILVNKFDQKDRNSDDAPTVKQNVPAMLDGDVLTAEQVYPGSSRQAYLANRARNVLSHSDALPMSEEWVKDFAQLAYGQMWDESDLQDKVQSLNRAEKIWRHSLFDKLITEVIHAAHAKAAALAVDSAASKLVQNAENAQEYLSVRHQGLRASITTLQQQINDLLTDIENVNCCQKSVDKEVTASMLRVKQESEALMTQVQLKLDGQIEHYFRDGKHQEKEEIESSQLKKRESSLGKFPWVLAKRSKPVTRDFDPDNPVVTFAERAAAEAFVAKIENSVMSLLDEIEGDIKPTLTDIVAGIEKSFHGNALRAIDNIANQINSRLEEGGFSIKISFPQVKNLQAPLSVRSRMTTLLEEKSFKETRSRRSSSMWGSVCKWFSTNDWGWEDYSVEVVKSVVDINKIKAAVEVQTKEHFKQLNKIIQEEIKDPIVAEIDLFFQQFKSKVEQLRNTLIQSTEDHKSDKQQQEQLTERLHELQKLTPEMILDGKALKEELEALL